MRYNQAFLFLRNYWLAILWAVIIAFGLFTSADKLPDTKLFEFDNLDKILHLLIFGFLEFLILLQMHWNRIRITRKRIFFSILLSFCYGIFTEIIQYLVISKRKGSFLDLFADLTGIMLALGFFFLVRNLINRWFPRKI